MSIYVYRLNFVNSRTDDAAVHANIVGIAVLANFRETYMPSIKPGMEVEVYLLTYPGRPFRGVLQGIGWVRKTLNWVRLANRFPVRILLEERDAERPFRLGTTAVVPIRGFFAQAAPAAPAR
jgi:membrane fusion protein, multidrug efflux system